MVNTYSSEIRELIKNALEKPLLIKRFYDGLYIVPQKKDSWESGYRDLDIYGVIKSENGISVEKVKTIDSLQINSFFKKLKGFQISIDIPYLDNIVSISCYRHLIEVDGLGFRFTKDKRKWVKWSGN